MANQAFANEMKDRAELMGRQAQDVMKTCFDINRQAYGVCFGNAQTLAKVEFENARKFYDTAFNRFAAAGMRDVALVPMTMAPESRDTLMAACEEARDHFVKTRDELLGVLSDGYRDIWSTLAESRTEVGTAAQKANEAPRPARNVKKAASEGTATARKTAGRTKRKTTSAKPRRAAGQGAKAKNPSASKSGEAATQP